MLISDFGEVPEPLVFFLGLSRRMRSLRSLRRVLVFLFCCGTVSKNILISWPMCLCFFGGGVGDCLEECAPVMAFGFLSFAYASMSFFTYSCLCMYMYHWTEVLSLRDTNQRKSFKSLFIWLWIVPAASRY